MKKTVLKELRERAELEIKAGFASQREILAMLSEVMKYDHELKGDELKEGKKELKELIDKLLEQHQKDQKKFPEVTDCDKLDAAFADLEQQGILTAQNAGYTQSDGFEDINERYYRLSKKEQKAYVGFVFFHGQDLERVLEGGPLLFAFGSGKGDKKLDVKAGKLIQKALEAHGFKVKWNGKSDTRLEISKFTWQKRR
jgi:hypothetical protein